MKARKICILLCCWLAALGAAGQNKYLNDKVMNRPYADSRAWHLGFSIGMHVQGLQLTHNGYITPEGAQWQIEQPDYSPGFCVNGLVDFRLNDYFSVRLSPGLYFGNRGLKMIDHTTGATERQSLKTTMIVLPIDLKYASQRMRNIRPYVVGGAMPAFDVSKHTGELIKLKPSDCYLTIGFGCDCYLPYFKFIPEVKFCFGLADLLQKDRPDLLEDPYKQQFTMSLSKATSKMIVFTLYFE